MFHKKKTNVLIHYRYCEYSYCDSKFYHCYRGYLRILTDIADKTSFAVNENELEGVVKRICSKSKKRVYTEYIILRILYLQRT